LISELLRRDAKATRWLRPIGRGQDAQWTILCFPYAGSGGSIFGRWPGHVPPNLEVWAVQFPGREERLNELPIVDTSELERHLIPVLLSLIDGPIAFFGHSLGALIAFRLASRLEHVHRRPIQHLFASARRAPHIQSPASTLVELQEAAFVARLVELGALPGAVKASPELLDVLIPALRADLMLSRQLESDAINSSGSLAISAPITGFSGITDSSVPSESIRAWKKHTIREFSLHHIDGDHYFVRRRGQLLMELMSHELTRVQV
jgi:medium-chain acyl-[acyl-carrier-protein] hydrolase